MGDLNNDWDKPFNEWLADILDQKAATESSSEISKTFAPLGAGEADLREYRFVVPLDVGGDVEDGGVLVYAAKGGILEGEQIQGKILSVKPDLYEAAKNNSEVNWMDINVLNKNSYPSHIQDVVQEASDKYFKYKEITEHFAEFDATEEMPVIEEQELNADDAWYLHAGLSTLVDRYDFERSLIGHDRDDLNPNSNLERQALSGAINDLYNQMETIEIGMALPAFAKDLHEQAKQELTYHQAEAIEQMMTEEKVADAPKIDMSPTHQ